MVVQRRLRPDEIQNMPPLNRQVYGIITSFGEGYRTSAMEPEMAEVINNATNKMAVSIGLSDAQELMEKLKAIKAKRNIKDLDGLKDYFKQLLKKRIKESFLEAGLDPELIEELEENEKQEDIRQDQEQNQDLFILTTNGNGERIIDREEEERDLQDRQKERQRQIAEKALRVLEALEKARDAIVKGKEIPEMDLSYLKDLTPQEFAKQMAVFKTFGLEPVTFGRDRQVRDDPEREVTLETVTKDDIEQGNVAFAIQFDKLKTNNWRDMALDAKNRFERNGLKREYTLETTIDENVINAIAGKGNAGRTNVSKEDEEVR